MPLSKTLISEDQLKVITGELIKNTSATLNEKEVNGTIINNYGQTTDVTLTLPEAKQGMSFIVVLGTGVAKYFRIKANTNNKIYLNGVAGALGGTIGIESAGAGCAISFVSFKTSENTYDWLAVAIYGDWDVVDLILQ